MRHHPSTSVYFEEHIIQGRSSPPSRPNHLIRFPIFIVIEIDLSSFLVDVWDKEMASHAANGDTFACLNGWQGIFHLCVLPFRFLTPTSHSRQRHKHNPEQFTCECRCDGKLVRWLSHQSAKLQLIKRWWRITRRWPHERPPPGSRNAALLTSIYTNCPM